MDGSTCFLMDSWILGSETSGDRIWEGISRKILNRLRDGIRGRILSDFSWIFSYFCLIFLSDVSKIFQQNPRESWRILQNLRKSCKISETSPHLLKPSKTIQNLPKPPRTSFNLPQTFQNLSKPFKTSQNLPKPPKI